MLTIPTNFGNYLLKKSNIELVWLVKMVVQKDSDYSASAFYFSDKIIDLDSGGTNYRVKRFLNTKSINIVQSIDIIERTATIGGITLELHNEKCDGELNLSDLFDDYRVWNRAVTIYVGGKGADDLDDDFLTLYVGIVRDYRVEGDRIYINIENDNSIDEAIFPQYVINTDSYSNCVPESMGTILGWASGDFPFYYGYDGTALSPARTKSQSNNMLPAVYVGLNSSGDHQYIVPDNIGVVDETNYRAWMYDTKLKRFVQIDTSDVSFAVGILTISNLPTVYDYWYPISAADNGESQTWSDPGNAIDDDYSTYASADVGGIADGFAAMDLEFADYDGYQDDANITAIKFGCKLDVNYDSLPPAGYGLRIDGDSFDYDDSQMNTDTLTATTTKAVIGDAVTIDVLNQVSESEHDPLDVKAYMFFKIIEYTVDEMFPVFIACKDAATPVDAPADILDDILDEYGITAKDTTAITAFDTETSDWVMGFYQDEVIKLDELFKKFGQQTNSIIFRNSTNQVSVFVFEADSSYSTVRTLNKYEIKRFISIGKTPLINIVNKLRLNYSKNYQSNKNTETLTREDDRANVSSQAIYNIETNVTIDADWINDVTTAGQLADHFCKDDDDSYMSQLHSVVRVELSDWRGNNYVSSGTLEPLIALELADVIEFDDTSLDSFILCNGESWDGKQFLITYVSKSPNSIIIECIEL